MAIVSSTRRRFTRGSARGVRGRRSPTDWDRLFVANVTIGVATKVLLAVFTPPLAGVALTLRRSLFNWSYDPSAAGATVGIGLLVAGGQAATIGATALPGPITDLADDRWAFWDVVGYSQGGAVTRPVPDLRVADIRSMRRIEEGEVLVLMAETGGVTCDVSVTLATLFSRSS